MNKSVFSTLTKEQAKALLDEHYYCKKALKSAKKVIKAINKDPDVEVKADLWLKKYGKKS